MITIENKYFVFTRWAKNKSHPQSIFNIDILPGIQAEFGEPKSKLHSKQFHLTQLKIHQDQYSQIFAEGFWKFFHIKYIHHKIKNKKLPQIYRVIGRPNHLIKDGYIIICDQSIAERTLVVFKYFMIFG